MEQGGKTINLTGYQIYEDNMTMAVQELLLENAEAQMNQPEFQPDLGELESGAFSRATRTSIEK